MIVGIFAFLTTLNQWRKERGPLKCVCVKMGGGMETNKNRWIEDWSTARENLEHNFRWSPRNLALVGIFGIAIPVLVYKGIIRDFVSPEDFFPLNFCLLIINSVFV